MWSESLGKEIARILNLMADKPNLRPHPKYADVKVFDGGQIQMVTGVTSYKFSDGSTAIYGTEPEWGLLIRLATGEEVHIDIPTTEKLPAPRNCPRCDNLIWLGERYCKRCGQDCA